MMPCAAHGDPQLGVDIHLCFAPFPTPLPSLHISVVFDPFEYLPYIGATIEVAGMKRATAGTCGIDIHIPPGFPFAPMTPNWDDMLYMGSSTVVADSEPLTYTALPVLGCQFIGMPSPPRIKKPSRRYFMLPTEVNLAIPKTVYVDGIPIISMSGLVAGAAFGGLGRIGKSRFGKWLGKRFKAFRKKLFGRMKPGFMKCKVLRAEPVNILTGEVSVEQSDFTLPGRIPIEWARSYTSNQRRKGACGVGWETPADGRLEFDLADGSVIFHYPDEGPAIFPQRPDAEGDEAAVLELMDGALLSDHGDEWRVRTKSDLIYHFPKSLARTVEAGLEEVSLGRITDLCGNWLEFQRRGSRLMAIRESAERYLRFDYKDGCINSISLYVPATDFTHPFVSYEYDQAGNLTTVRDALDNPYTFAYDHHHMVRHTNRTGLSFYYEYDKQGEDWQVVHAWGDGGLYDYHFAYWPKIHETRITDSLGHVTTVKCDANGLPILEIDPLGGRTIFEYDEVGRTTAVVNPANHRLEYLYDQRGNLLKLTQPDDSSFAIEVDSNNKPVTIAAPNGAIWRQEWDERGLMVSQTSPLGAITRYHYDQGGLPLSQTDAYQVTTRLGFDAYGALANITDAEDNTTHLQHDEMGKLLVRTDALGRNTRYGYDLKSRLLEVSLPGGSRICCAYDDEDNLIDYENEQGVHTRFEYCGLDMVAKRRDAGGAAVEYHYDTEEQLIGVTNQRGERHELRRDALGRVIEEVDYWGQVTCYSFDTAGYLKQRIDPLGQVTDYVTDKLGRILRKSFAHPEHAGKQFEERFEFDVNGNLTDCSNEHGRVERCFDPENRLLEEKQAGFVIRNEYDKLGRRIRRETSRGHVVAYQYDQLSRPVSIQIDDESPITLKRNATGQITQEQLSQTLERHYRYDEAGRLVAQGVRGETDWLFQTQYAYDPVGNLIQRNDSQQGIDRYRYDPLGQIVEHIDPQGRLKQYLQDPMGDRLETRVVETPARQVVGGEQVSGEWYREGYYNGVYYRFDRAGNLRQKQNQGVTDRDGATPNEIHLTWDANQQLVSSERNGVVTSYGYDPLGRRLFKRTGMHQTWFGWDGDALVVEGEGVLADPKPLEQSTAQMERTADNQQREYLYYPGSFEPLALIDVDVSYRYNIEPNGCPTRILSTDGCIVWAASYEVWDRADTYIDSVDNHLCMQGQYRDKETGLYYNRHRYYDPEAGQFISQDPIGLLGGVNNYQYALNGLRWIDPLGLECEKIKWKGFSKGQLNTHYKKHVVELNEFGENITQVEYLKRAKAFAKEPGNFNETRVGNFLIKHDPVSGRVFIGHGGTREIRTFYIDDGNHGDAFQSAINYASRL